MCRDSKREKARLEHKKINLERQKMKLPQVETPEENIKQPIQIQQQEDFLVEIPDAENSMHELTVVPKEESVVHPAKYRQENNVAVETPNEESLKSEESLLLKEVSNIQSVTFRPPVKNHINESGNPNELKQKERDNERKRIYKSRRK